MCSLDSIGIEPVRHTNKMRYPSCDTCTTFAGLEIRFLGYGVVYTLQPKSVPRNKK